MSEGVMSSYMQNNNKGRKSPIYMPMCEKNMSNAIGASGGIGGGGAGGVSGAAADKDSPRRTIIELKVLMVDGDGIDENNAGVVAAPATCDAADAVTASIDDSDNNRTQCSAANGGNCSAHCKSASENVATEARPSFDPINKTMPSTNDDSSSSVTMNRTQCDSDDCDNDLCAQATPANENTNNKENVKQKDCDDDTTGAEHDPAVFRLYCECDDCLEYREMLIQLIVEDREYNILWDRLKALIREFYDVVPQNPLPYEGSMDEKYESMVQKQARWFSDGQIDNQKNIQLSLSSHLPLSNEMTFVLVFSMLYTRDPHQLFELLCIQLRCIAVAYSDGVKKLITTDADGKNPKYNPIQLLDVILDGYDKFCSTATKLSSLLFELQRDHLQHFSLTWTLLNKRMYQRWVYFEVQDLIPECILMLKDLLDSENYHIMAHRLIRFDEDMTSITQSWIEVWTFLQNYYLESEEDERRVRISYLEEMLKTIRERDFSRYGTLKEPAPMAQWGKLENRQEAWLQMIDYLKKVWNEKDDSRLTVRVLNDNCVKCEFELASHYIDCECVTCSLAGGPNQRRDPSDSNEADTRCAKCVFYEQLDLDYLSYVKRDLSRALDEPFPCLEASEDDSDNDIDDIWKTNHSYHLAWAVFKHLADRKAYSALKFDPRHFCMFQNPPCPRTECRVATHIIAGLFPLNFCKFLIKAYQPLNEEDRKGLKRNVHFTYLMQKNSMDLMLNLQDTDYTEFCHVGSTFAEFYLIDAPIPVQEILYSCFIVENNDIELNMYWLECIHMFRANENSPLQLQMDQIGSTKREKKLLSVLKLTDDTKYMPAAITEAVNLADFIVKKRDAASNVKMPLAATVWPSKGDATTTNTPEPSIFNDVSEEVVSKFELNGMDLIKELVRKSKTCKETPSPTAKPKAVGLSDVAAVAATIDKDEPLTDAVKIAVKQKLNQKLEAELKVLKKEHSVLKEMVRDLEQIKENGESQLIAKKEKCSSHANANGQHCCSDHSDMMDNHANHTKICHRGDGQCTCYYCTIFGHAECNHGRMNETRDRLRKRLHQIHSKSSTKSHNTKNIKSQPGINLKKLLATASNGNGNGNASGGTATSAKCIPKSVAEQKENNANETLEEALKTKPNVLAATASQRMPLDHSKSGQNVASQQRTTSAVTTNIKSASESAPSATTTNSASASSDVKNTIKKRKLLNVNQHYQNLYECDYGLCSSCDEHRQKVKPTRMAAPTQSARTRGISPSKLSDETLASVRRASFCPVAPPETASLDDILDFIEGNTTSKKDSQKKAAKKAKQKQKKEDIKKIEDLEQLRIEFHDMYFKEFDAKNELKALKSVKKRDKKRIAETEGTVKKFGKFKAKVESSILELISGLKKNNADFKFAYLPTKEQQQDWQRQQEEEQRISPSVTEMKGNCSAGTEPVSANDGDGQQHQQPASGENMSDQSKRMVTIRRINLPHSEPQVTVTAKGASPDKDKLLYTFINGQLIPGATPASGSSASAPSKPDKKSKADGKLSQPVEPATKAKNGKKTNQAAQPVTEVVIKKGSKEKAKSNGKQSPETIERSVSIKSDAGKKAPAAAPVPTVTDKKKQKAKKNSVEEDIASVTSATKAMTLAEEKPKKEKRKVRAVKFEYADPNYKVNQFDLLDMDEDDEYYTESSSSDEEEPAKPAPVVNAKPVRIQPETTHASQTSKRNVDKHVPPPSSAKPTQKQQPEPHAVVSQPQNTNNPGTVLSKKQKKKLAQQQQQQQQSVPNDKTATKSLTSQMQRLQLNADTTIELVNDNHHKAYGQMPPNVSIMDQLNRGVKVEGLMLPPGITLTRVDPSTAEGLRAKKESIGRLSHPAPHQYQQPPEYQRPPPPFLHANVPTNKHQQQPPQMQQHSNGFIMVDPMQKQHSQTSSLNGDASKKSKAKKKKNKKTGDAPLDTAAATTTSNQNKIVTLRNPLFQSVVPGAHDARGGAIPAHSAFHRGQMPPMNVNQHASITKNDNGMFTIRNPALNPQLPTVNTQYRPYVPELFPHEVKNDNFSYFSENTGRHSSTQSVQSYAQPIPMPPSSGTVQQKSTQAIGSEIKSAHPNKNMPWNPQTSKNPTQVPPTQNGDIFSNMSQLTPQRYSPFDASTNYGYSWPSPTPTLRTASSSTPTTTTATSNQYYNGAYNSYTANAVNSDSLFSSGVDASNCGSNGFYRSNEDYSFLNSLHPGQRLNSEVTIHNIGDAKFGRDPSTTTAFNDGVEITRVNGPMAGAYGDIGASRVVGSQRHSLADTKSDTTTTTEFGDSVFLPNQSVDLSKLGPEEREIESFKRFNWYFQPPKNKPKINFNVKDIVVTKKQPASDNSSPNFGELASSSLCNTPPLLRDEEYSTHASSMSLPSSSSHDLNAPTPSRCDPSKGIAHQSTTNFDNFLHGIIGDELNVDRV